MRHEASLANIPQPVLQRVTNEKDGSLRILRATLTPTRHLSWSRPFVHTPSISAACRSARWWWIRGSRDVRT